MLPQAWDYGKYTACLWGSLKRASSSPPCDCLCYWTLGGKAKLDTTAIQFEGNGVYGVLKCSYKYLQMAVSFLQNNSDVQVLLITLFTKEAIFLDILYRNILNINSNIPTIRPSATKYGSLTNDPS